MISTIRKHNPWHKNEEKQIRKQYEKNHKMRLFKVIFTHCDMAEIRVMLHYAQNAWGASAVMSFHFFEYSIVSFL